MAAAINGKRRRSEPARLPSPSSLWPYLSSCSHSCASLCLLSAPTHSLEHQIPSIAASGSRRRRREFVAAGEGQPPPPFSLSLWVHQGLTSSDCCRFSSPEPVGAAPRQHRSAARPAAVAKLRHRRIFFTFELARFSFEL
jgi:hypothetical protein